MTRRHQRYGLGTRVHLKQGGAKGTIVHAGPDRVTVKLDGGSEIQWANEARGNFVVDVEIEDGT